MAEKLYGLTGSDRQKIAELLRVNGVGGSAAPGFVMPPERQLAKINFKCDEACPAYGLMRITGATLNASKWPTLDTVKPDDTFARQYLVNLSGPAISDGAGGYVGCGTLLQHAGHVLYNTSSGTPAYGEVWGPKSGQWSLEKHYYGFLIQGGNTGSGDSARTVAVQSVVDQVLGKTDASHAKGASGTVSIWAGAGGSEADTTMNITGVYNRFANVASGKWVWVQWNGLTPYLTAAEC